MKSLAWAIPPGPAVPVPIALTTTTQVVLCGGWLGGGGQEEGDSRSGERRATSLGQELATGGHLIGRFGNFRFGHDNAFR